MRDHISTDLDSAAHLAREDDPREDDRPTAAELAEDAPRRRRPRADVPVTREDFALPESTDDLPF